MWMNNRKPEKEKKNMLYDCNHDCEALYDSYASGEKKGREEALHEIMEIIRDGCIENKSSDAIVMKICELIGSRTFANR